MNVVRRVPAVVLLVALALLPLQAWLQVGRADIRYWQPVDGLAGITWSAAVSPDGRLSVSIVYDFGDDQVRNSSIRLPSGSGVLRTDGNATAARSGRFAEVQAQSTLTVTYERVGAVTRYSDGVIVDFDGTENSDQALFPCARCYLGVDEYGNAALSGALFADDVSGARFALGGLDQLHGGNDDRALRFLGVMPGADSASLIAWLPLTAAPDAPTRPGVPDAIRGETAAQVWDASLEAADGELVEVREPSVPIGRVALSVMLSAMWLLMVAWVVRRLLAARRVLNAERPDAQPARDAAFSPPSDLEPAVVSVLVGGAGPGDRSAVAAVLLGLAERGAIHIEGADSRRYTLTIPAGVSGNVFEEVVLSELRPQGKKTSTATLTGPPLWGAGGASVERRLARVAGNAAREAQLMRVTLTAWVLVPASFAMGLVAVVGSSGSSRLAVTMTLLGPLVAVVATVLTGTSWTAKGRAEREQWLAYGSWLRTNSQLHGVGAPGIATWGKPLVYATVLGAAPTAAGALGAG
jgi:hypothetical protein